MWNKISRSSLSIAWIATASLCSCSYSTFYVPTERVVYAPMLPSTVAISAQKTVNYPHKILGRVASISFGGADSARTRLQEEAAKIGANLIIDLKLEKGVGRTSASGLAVLVYQGKDGEK